ncbi:protein of unknown function [Halogranum amylolyticum]|uniref:DUF5058 domain-containing protein n=1 Tax=Halogranum amylolyticum TaxID=660520 RepID=A0A1H8UDX8_9EURY|nr:DUF5058 family protein [Halogranum amylolyticum]SEP00828.1 protein of unknown function [Halogranum amylolyticum]
MVGYQTIATVPIYMDIANSTWLWLATVPVVLVVLLQAGLFLQRAWKNGNEMGLSDEQLKTGLKTGVISAIGPAVAVLAGMLALIATVGGPVAWMRLSVIGSVAFELPAAELGVSQFGYSLGDDGISEQAYATAVWSMTLGGTGWLLVSALGTPHMEKVRQRIGGGKEKLIPIISSAAMLGAFAYFLTGEVTAGTPETGSVAAGGLAMLGLLQVADKKDVQWIREWALGIAMVVGLAVGIIIQLSIGSLW